MLLLKIQIEADYRGEKGGGRWKPILPSPVVPFQNKQVTMHYCNHNKCKDYYSQNTLSYQFSLIWLKFCLYRKEKRFAIRFRSIGCKNKTAYYHKSGPEKF